MMMLSRRVAAKAAVAVARGRRCRPQWRSSLVVAAATHTLPGAFSNSNHSTTNIRRFQSTNATAAEMQPPAAAAAAAVAPETSASTTKKSFTPTEDRKYEFFCNVNVTDSGVALVKFDCCPNNSNSNSFSVSRIIQEAQTLWTSEILDINNSDSSSANVKAVVLSSNKPGSSFLTTITGGAKNDQQGGEDDGTVLNDDALEFFQKHMRSKPVVAAVDGPALGAGLEWALWCDSRICTAANTTQFGFPLPVFPVLGGTQTLPALIGLKPALDMMLKGKVIGAPEAKQLGLVDVVVDDTNESSLESVAIQRAEQLATGTLQPNHHAHATSTFNRKEAQERLSFIRMNRPKRSSQSSQSSSSGSGVRRWVYKDGERLENVNGTIRDDKGRVVSNWDGKNLDPCSVKRHKVSLKRAGFVNNAHAKGFF